MKRKSTPTRRPSTRGALVIIAALLVGSALLRIGENAGKAYALAPDEIATSTLEPAQMPEGSYQTAAELKPMLDAFQQREARIAEQEAALRKRMKALRVAEEEVDKKLAALEDAEAKLSATIALAETASEGDLDRLTKVYESMKPKQAAALFEEMEPAFAAGFIGRMRPESAAAIMAGLTPEAAHMFSVVLAGRNAEVPRE